MNSRLVAFVFVLVTSFLPTPFLRAQDTDKEVDDAIQEATESAKKMGLKMPDVKKQLEEVDKEEAKEKAALQKQLEAPGPVALPDWTPKVPQFKPAGPVSKKIVGDEVDIIQTGTSPRQEPLQSVVLEASRAPEEKITHVTISSPLPKPVVEEE